MGIRRRAAALAGAVVTTVACGAGGASGGAEVVEPVRTVVHVDRVAALSSGECVVVYKASCPKDGAACDAETYGRESIACPEGLNAGQSMELFHNAEGCSVEWTVTCDPDSTCNPPEPMPIACPAQFRPAPAPRVIRRPDGTCVEQTSVTCPPDFSCNPPPPQPVPCPDEEPTE